jgi:hypothetical protein
MQQTEEAADLAAISQFYDSFNASVQAGECRNCWWQETSPTAATRFRHRSRRRQEVIPSRLTTSTWTCLKELKATGAFTSTCGVATLPLHPFRIRRTDRGQLCAVSSLQQEP